MTQIVYTTHINLVTRSIKIIFKAYKKTNEIFSNNTFFCI